MTMLTEFEIRRRMAEVERSAEPPLRKARSFLRLGRVVRQRAAALRATLGLARGAADPNAVAGLRRLERRDAILSEDLRRAAHRSLRSLP